MTEERHGPSPPPRGGDEPLDREIRRLLAADPSPAFEARVRARVAAEPATNAWRGGRLWMAFGAATAALVLAVAVFRPEPPADTGAGSGLGAARAGGTAPPPSGIATRVVRDDPAAVSLPVGLAETSAALEPAFPRALEAGLRVAAPAAAGEPRGAGYPPAPAATPPGPPRFTRVVFSESETAALRRLLSRAPARPVIVPVPVEARTPAVGEPPAELVIPPIAIEPPLTIEPLNVALLDTGADQ